MLDLQYHDVSRERGIFYRLQARGAVERIVTDEAIATATEQAPRRPEPACEESHSQGQGAAPRLHCRLVHLKLNDQTQRTVLLKDPFKAYDERVERMIEAM